MITRMLLLLCCILNWMPAYPQNQATVNIHFWYGEEQHFGDRGQPQWALNVLGNISGVEPGLEAFYRYHKDSAWHALTLGSDLHRLAQPGDFNIEIDRRLLAAGEHTVWVQARVGDKLLVQDSMVVILKKDNIWPLPYQIQWKHVMHIQDVAEIVDGDWMITDRGIRTREPYYDRILIFGDASWKNYEVHTSVIFHDLRQPEAGPPTYNVAHAAIAVRWPGHTPDGRQPSRAWHPLGATAEFRLDSGYTRCRWRIFDGDHFYAEEDSSKYQTIAPGVRYRMVHRVKSLDESRTRYSVKLWPEQKPEPEQWDFQAIEVNPRQETGSVCLIAHHTDVTFGNIVVLPLDH